MSNEGIAILSLVEFGLLVIWLTFVAIRCEVALDRIERKLDEKGEGEKGGER